MKLIAQRADGKQLTLAEHDDSHTLEAEMRNIVLDRLSASWDITAEGELSYALINPKGQHLLLKVTN